jgi:hypothetical protein
MAIDFDAHAHLADLRLRVLNGEQPSAAEMRELLLDLQRGRDMAAAASASQRRTAAKAAKAVAKRTMPIDIDALFAFGSEPKAHSKE